MCPPALFQGLANFRFLYPLNYCLLTCKLAYLIWIYRTHLGTGGHNPHHDEVSTNGHKFTFQSVSSYPKLLLENFRSLCNSLRAIESCITLHGSKARFQFCFITLYFNNDCNVLKHVDVVKNSVKRFNVYKFAFVSAISSAWT